MKPSNLARIFVFACGAALLSTQVRAEGPQADSPAQYILGPEDQISIRALDVDEIPNGPIQIGSDGLISLPLVGAVKAAGLSVRDLEATLQKKLGEYVRRPQVSVSVLEYRSQPVSVLGAVVAPGVQQVRGSKTLLEMLAMAGGASQDSGYTLTIVRQKDQGDLPLPEARVDPQTGVKTADIDLSRLLAGRAPDLNIPVHPRDVITVPRASVVYVLGEVSKAGGFALKDHQSVSVLQALALAGGMTRTASRKNVRILRVQPGQTDRQEIAVDVRKIEDGKGEDFTLHPDDILFIPNNIPKSASLRAAEAALQVGTGLAIWRF